MRRLLPFIAALALPFAACGGEEGMSTEDYRAEAKKICVDAERQTDAIEQPTRSTTDAIVDYLGRLADANGRAIDRFQKLDPPEDLQDPHAELLKAQRDGQQAVRGVIDDLEAREDPRTVLEASTDRLRELGRRSDAAAKRLGVPECEQ